MSGYVIGVDEAGYGPNFGPLVITATVWQVPGSPNTADLYSLLAGGVTAELDDDAQRVTVADSKRLYLSGRGLQLLERNLLAALQLCVSPPTRWLELWDMVSEGFFPLRDQCFEAAHEDRDLPLEAELDDIRQAGQKLAGAARAARVELVAVKSRVVFAGEFNELLALRGNKATVLSELSVELVSGLLASLDDGPALVNFDRHGGRQRYAGLLQHAFPERLIEVVDEDPKCSVYRWRCDTRPTRMRFLVKGERELPTALASMTSKYLREIFMRAFNAFWLSHVDGLTPTAGYPMDSTRFRSAIQHAQAALGIADAVLWRER